ncbi:RHS domain-containing protein [Acidovorax sp. GBBC 1281]|uniref:RHS domain-containing protein n=1 Tax=Acidovorax sp. SUPP2522 TaxID=511900 RepID=UPI00234AC028|nr:MULTISPECIES: RHS domain-containing protein [unclassified Acidovorax]WCM98911.1 RHS domain-containing protein [Acidovorax sp. GBBC 1281]
MDAFGRTRFVYDGDLLAGEIRGSKVSEYLYEPDSFVPLAKLESEAKQAPVQEVLGHIATKDVANEKAEDKDFAIYYYQCDQIGAPQELTDEAGRIVWAASYKVWGQTHRRCRCCAPGRAPMGNQRCSRPMKDRWHWRPAERSKASTWWSSRSDSRGSTSTGKRGCITTASGTTIR